jgi:hypothetical protein
VAFPTGFAVGRLFVEGHPAAFAEWRPVFGEEQAGACVLGFADALAAFCGEDTLSERRVERGHTDSSEESTASTSDTTKPTMPPTTAPSTSLIQAPAKTDPGMTIRYAALPIRLLTVLSPS